MEFLIGVSSGARMDWWILMSIGQTAQTNPQRGKGQIVAINRDRGITLLLVEQNANLALEVSHRGYVLETGRITLTDAAAALRSNAEVRKAYLGG